MRKLSLRAEDLRIQSFATAAAAPELRGTLPAGVATVLQTCGNPPDTDALGCEYGRDGTTRPVHCCV